MGRRREQFVATVGLVAAAFAAAPALAASDDDIWRFEARLDHHVDAVSLSDLNDLDRAPNPRRGINFGFVNDEVRLSRQSGSWRWSVLARSSARLVTDRDTLEAASQAAGLTDPQGDQDWRAKVLYRGFSGAGVAVSKGIQLGGGWRAQAGAQILSLAHWRERTLDGSAAYSSATGSYRFDLRSTERSDNDRLPFQQKSASRGTALLFDATLSWSDDRWSTAVGLRDAGWLQWRRMPFENLVLASATQTKDSDGFLIYKPLIEGKFGSSSRREWNSPWWHGAATRRITDSGILSVGLDAFPSSPLIGAIGWTEQFGPVTARVSWQPRLERVTVGAVWGGLSMSFGADRLGAEAHSQAVALAFAHTF